MIQVNNRSELLERAFHSVQSLPVSVVLSRRMTISRKKYRHQYGLCPFHADTKEGSFVITDDKGMWECFTCCLGGNSIKFISLFDRISYVDAAVQIALEFGLLTFEESCELLQKKEYTDKQVMSMTRQFAKKETIENKIASPDILNDVYALLIQSAGISDDHIRYLNKNRNLSTEDIKSSSYFTFPTRRILKSFMADIRERFGSEKILGSVPGFCWDIENKRYTFAQNKGLGIPIYNVEGLIVGIQIRKDDELNLKRRYVWFSSSFTDHDERFSKGSSPGAPPDIHFPQKLLNSTVYLTEGHFKAKIITKEFGSIALSVQGVGSQRGILASLKQIPKEVLKRELSPVFEIGSIFLAFDADLAYNIRVYEQLKKMSDTLLVNNYQNYYLYWSESAGKGIDDVIDGGNIDQINIYDKALWDKAYLSMEDKLRMKENSNIYKIPKAVVAQYFSIVLSMVTPVLFDSPYLPPNFTNPITKKPDIYNLADEFTTDDLIVPKREKQKPSWRRSFYEIVNNFIKKIPRSD